MISVNDHAFNPKILREYDIRGTIGDSLSTKDAFLLGQRFGQVMVEQNLKIICVGRDGRLSSESLFNSLIEGLIQHDLFVKDIGMGPTPLLYFSVKHLQADAGIMVTGSHNPPEDNGFKITLSHRPFFGSDIQKLNDEKGFFASQKGHVEKVFIHEDYIERLLKDYISGKRLKVVWDPGHGAAGEIIQNLATSNRLAVDSILINETIDGTFPAHHPDPTVPKNLAQLIETVKKNSYDLGIAFDGDADRIGVVDGQGRILWGDQLMVLWAKDILKSNSGSTIIADIKASQILFDQITSFGGHAVMAPTGHSIIKQKISELKALLAGEMSGHIFFADHYYGYDDAIYAAIRLLNILHNSPYSLSELFDQIPKSVNTPEIRIPCKDSRKFQIIKEIQNQLRQQSIDFIDIDGIRLQTKEGWWLLRASNTQPILVARCEASNQQDLETLKKMLQGYLKGFGLDLPTE